jgi:hypothetical protein
MAAGPSEFLQIFSKSSVNGVAAPARAPRRATDLSGHARGAVAVPRGSSLLDLQFLNLWAPEKSANHLQ